MSNTPKRWPVTDALKTLLNTELGVSVGVGRAPVNGASNVSPPYVVIEPLGKGSFWGPAFAFPFSNVCFKYDIKSVGGNYEAAQRLSDDIREVLTGRDDDGLYLYTINVTGHTVIDRMPEYDSPGRPKFIGIIVEIDDSYGITVTTS